LKAKSLSRGRRLTRSKKQKIGALNKETDFAFTKASTVIA
jgi:hypothetical protein